MIKYTLDNWNPESQTTMLKSILILDREHAASQVKYTGPRSAVGKVSGYRCVSDCRSRGREFDPGPVPYFRGD